MKVKILLIIIVVLYLGATSYAKDVQGIIRDNNAEPLTGAIVHWKGTTIATSSDIDGKFTLHREKGYNHLVISYIGYTNDTISVDRKDDTALDITLYPLSGTLNEVVVTSGLHGNLIKQNALAKTEMITFTGLTKMACCNLAESFENSASVTVGYSDAISGSRQIKMLGLAGTYTQILDESRPIMRGLSSPYGLNYTPGMWLSSIQVSKGVASVTAGHDAITGQINLEYRKPTDQERLFVNAYIDDQLRLEANVTSAFPVTKDKRLSSIVMVHGSTDTEWRNMSAMDINHDGFRDLPKSGMINVANKWLYAANNDMQIRWGWKYVNERRLGGMMSYKNTDDMRTAMYNEWNSDVKPLYGSHISNSNANAYVKIAKPMGEGVYDEENKSELRSNLAFVADYEHFKEQAYFGLNDYNGTENSGNINLMYNHYFSIHSSLVVGAQARLSFYDEDVANRTPWLAHTGHDAQIYNLNRNEHEAGAYAEYTYNLKDKISVVAGLRGDYNSYYNRFYVTPRGHIKWNITPTTALRGSAGMGYRSTNIMTDNIGIFATGRQIIINSSYNSTGFNNLNRMEKALTVGGSLTQTFSLFGDKNGSISFDFFRTSFYNSVVVDQEWNPNYINIYGSTDKSYTNSYQVDLSWSPITRLDIFATFRYTDSKMTINRPDGSTAQVERPLINNYKALVNVQYATKFRRWVFDATAQLNGKARIPSQTGITADASYSPHYPMFYAQVTHKIGKFNVYLGCENIAGYTQKTPIQNVENPYSTAFNSMNIWGPLMGRKFYAGMRFNLY